MYPVHIIIKTTNEAIVAKITKSHKLYPHTCYGVLDESGSFSTMPIRNLEKALKTAKKHGYKVEYC